jgi:hypothetical protein
MLQSPRYISQYSSLHATYHSILQSPHYIRFWFTPITPLLESNKNMATPGTLIFNVPCVCLLNLVTPIHQAISDHTHALCSSVHVPSA